MFRSLYVLYCGSILSDKGNVLTYRVDVGKKVEIPVSAYLIRAEGGNILFDTGVDHDDFSYLTSIGKELKIKKEDFLLTRLQEAGVSPEEINFVFQKKEIATATTINGTVRLDSGTPVEASIWAWSEKGGSAQGKSGADGKFSLQVTFGERWRIGAGKEVSGSPYKSSEVIVDTNNVFMTVEIVLVRVGVVPLPKSVSISQDASQPAVAQLGDRMKLIMPAGAAALSGTITVDVAPTAEGPSHPGARGVSTIYDVTIKDQKGKGIISLSKEVELVIPYDEADLKARGVTEDMIVPGYFDEAAGIWVKADNYTIDKKNKVAVVRIKHLTRFALVSTVDIVPPSAPTSVAVKQIDIGKTLIQWTSPSYDFSYVKIYRSTQAGALGSVVFAEMKGNSQTDSGLRANVKYYYTIRAVDPAGNESTNTNQSSITLT